MQVFSLWKAIPALNDGTGSLAARSPLSKALLDAIVGAVTLGDSDMAYLCRSFERYKYI